MSAITFKIYGDGSQVTTRAGAGFTKSVTDEKAFKLPGGSRYIDHECEVMKPVLVMFSPNAARVVKQNRRTDES